MFQAIKNWFVGFLHLQLIITLFSMPVFILWGLPVSLFSLFGNLIFSPLLVLFIAICCAITFCAMIGIPHAFFAYCLELVSLFWYKLLSLGSPSWLTGCSLKMFPISIICCIISYLMYKKYNPSKQEMIFLHSFLLLIIFSTKIFLQNNFYFTCDNMIILKIKNQTICLDNGTFSRKRSPQSWIDYTLLSELVKYTGTPHIDTFIGFVNNKRTYHAAKLLQRQAGVNKIIFHPKGPHARASFF